MTYSEEQESLVYFSDEEKEKIEKWLEKHGYTWGTAHVCGSCCGFYADEYWVGWLGDKGLTDTDAEKLRKWAKKQNINCKVEGDDITATE